MSVFKNHKGKIILIVSLLLTYPIFINIKGINFPNWYAALLAAFVLSFIISDIVIRSMIGFSESKTIIYCKQSLDESDMMILWNQVLSDKCVRIDLNQKTFALSIRTKEYDNICEIEFYILDPDGICHKDKNSKLFDSMKFSEYIDYSYFRDQLCLKCDELIKIGKEVYGDETIN